MKAKRYGGGRQTEIADEIDRHIEEVTIKGYSIIPGLLSAAELATWRTKIDQVYERQEKEFGRDELESIQDLNVCRAPLLYDEDFIGLAAHPGILPIIERMLGAWFILNLQNAVINRPEIEHHQSSWHRDLPHQNFVISSPLAINALFAMDEFSAKTGGTQILPFSHRSEDLPSDAYIERNLLTVDIPAGSAIIFDAMLFHRAGSNRSDMIRRAVNHLYTRPILKQQYDFPVALQKGRTFEPKIAQLLGMTSQVPSTDVDWRRSRLKRKKA